MANAAARARRDLVNFRVERVLALLEDEHLRDAAALLTGPPCELVFECNFIDQITDDPRIKARVAQLAGQDIQVVWHRHVHEVEGRQYERWQIRVSF